MNPIVAATTVNLMGVAVKRIGVGQFVDGICSFGSNSQKTPVFITYLNAACSNLAADDREYSSILNGCDCVYADGQAIVWAAKVFGFSIPERVNAGDFILEFCREASVRNLKISLVGGRPGVAEKAAAAWRLKAPGFQISETHDGFFGDKADEVIESIASSKSDILLVGMGAPLQEKWAWENRNRFGVKVIWCVGALFEYYGEGRPRAPVWIRRAGMEWLFRLVLEPRRLWHRYLIGNVLFVWRMIKFRSQLKRSPSQL